MFQGLFDIQKEGFIATHLRSMVAPYKSCCRYPRPCSTCVITFRDSITALGPRLSVCMMPLEAPAWCLIRFPWKRTEHLNIPKNRRGEFNVLPRSSVLICPRASHSKTPCAVQPRCKPLSSTGREGPPEGALSATGCRLELGSRFCNPTGNL